MVAILALVDAAARKTINDGHPRKGRVVVGGVLTFCMS